MAVPKAKPGKTETYIGFVILFVLLVIAAGVLIKQSRYDAAIFTATLPEKIMTDASDPSSNPNANLQDLIPEGLAPLTAAENFGPENLSDKIDGKAELYLSANFVGLHSQRFALRSSPDTWMELFLYDMGTSRNAFAVYSAQKRAEAKQVDLTRFAYLTGNALFFVHGHEYVEMVAATASEPMVREMLAFGRTFIASRPVEADKVGEMALFPPDQLEEQSISLLATDAFGFEGLDNVFIANYTLDNAHITAFLSLRGSTREAAELAQAYRQFLLKNGGVDVDTDGVLPGVRLVEIFDSFEVIFSRGRLLAGIHEAENKDSAVQLARRLYEQMAEVAE